MVTGECCHGYLWVLSWLPVSVVMVTGECCHGNW